MFYSYKGIGVDIKEGKGSYYACIGNDIEIGADTIEALKDLLKIEVEFLREKYYEDVMPIEYEHSNLSEARSNLFGRFQKLSEELKSAGNLIQNPLFCLESKDVDEWNKSIDKLLDNICESVNLTNSYVEESGWK